MQTSEMKDLRKECRLADSQTVIPCRKLGTKLVQLQDKHIFFDPEEMKVCPFCYANLAEMFNIKN